MQRLAVESPFSAANQERISRLIELEAGIKMPAEKRQLLVNRLARRLKELGLDSYDTYCEYIFNNPHPDEIGFLINAIATHKTEFFREMGTFDFLSQGILPDLADARGEPLEIWSAACSSGEEPYSVAMLCQDGAIPHRILATDISTDILEKALAAVYRREQLDQIPPEFHGRFLLFPRDSTRPVFRIAPAVRSSVRFRRLNLLNFDPPDQLCDVILCRNVLIYFEPATRAAVIARLSGSLRRGGYLLIGTSESLLGIETDLRSVAPGIYKKP